MITFKVAGDGLICMKVGTWVVGGIIKSGIEYRADRSNIKVTITQNRSFRFRMISSIWVAGVE